MDHVTVSRTITVAGLTITETVTGSLPDDVALDDIAEAGRRSLFAQFLFSSLPSLKPKTQTHKCPPLNLPN